MFGAIYQGEECSKLSIAKLNKLTWKYKARNKKKSKKIKCYKTFINKQELISIKMWESDKQLVPIKLLREGKVVL